MFASYPDAVKCYSSSPESAWPKRTRGQEVSRLLPPRATWSYPRRNNYNTPPRRSNVPRLLESRRKLLTAQRSFTRETDCSLKTLLFVALGLFRRYRRQRPQQAIGLTIRTSSEK